MPKNYQISQYDLPICLGGGVPLPEMAYPKDAQKSIAAPDKVVPLVRIHLEEDVAKSFHFETSTGIDFNRAGTPLMEIVCEPEIDSPEEAFAYLAVAEANPGVRRRERCRHGEGPIAVRLQRLRAAARARRSSARRSRSRT